MKVPILKSPPNYYLVGATWDSMDMSEEFYIKKIWRSNWGLMNSKFMELLQGITIGDRIAIKKGLGVDNDRIVIKAIGVIREIDIDEDFCTIYVDWLREDMNRKVASKGCYRMIHGPFSNNPNNSKAEWVNQIFCI